MATETVASVDVPFDMARLDGLMEDAALDALIVSSPHNLRYLLGGYRHFFFDKVDQFGDSRHTPLLGYVRGRPDLTFYVGWRAEPLLSRDTDLWVATSEMTAWNALQAGQQAARLMKARIAPRTHVGIEPSFLNAEAYIALTEELRPTRFETAGPVLDWLRAIKRQDELASMRTGTEADVDSMLAVFATLEPGQSKAEIAKALRLEQTKRELDFAYCLIAAAPSLDRAPSAQTLDRGAALSLDSGGTYKGYVADVSRMGVVGDPTTLQQELLGMLLDVVAAARAMVGPGARGGDVVQAAEEAIRGLPSPELFFPDVHGTGLCHHEAPRIHNKSGPFPATDHECTLEAGMVLSIEADVRHPEGGFIKIEDMLAVTADGYEAYGDRGRGWNQP